MTQGSHKENTNWKGEEEEETDSLADLSTPVDSRPIQRASIPEDIIQDRAALPVR